MRIRTGIFFVSTLLLGAQAGFANPVIIDFETFSDLDAITNQLPGLAVQNAFVFEDGFSLNGFDFPPRSGSRVGTNLDPSTGNANTVRIDFANPVQSVGAYFTYAGSILVSAFDAANGLISSAGGAYSRNDFSFGDPGSSPNEFIELLSLSGISAVEFSGGPFVFDDLTYNELDQNVIPEPSHFVPAIGMILGVLYARRKRANIIFPEKHS